MYCKSCGQEIAAGSKFCSACGEKVVMADENKTETVISEIDTKPIVDSFSFKLDENEPLFEPFDFKEFGFDFENLGLGTGVERSENGVPVTSSSEEEFNWNTSVFPDREVSKTEDIDFNWSISDEPKAPAAEPETFKPAEPKWEAPETQAPAAPVADEPVKAPTLEEELFGGLDSKTDETKKQSEEIDKFFTFHKKNEEFQKILDREYEKVKTGNILTEEMDAAKAASEEKFTARQPEDPMEALFAAEGVVKGYEPKPVETNVLDIIDAADEDKKAREEAARIIEAEREKARLEAEQAAQTAAEPVETEPAVEADQPEEAPVAEPIIEETAHAVEEPQVEELVVEDVVEEVETPAAPVETPVAETPAAEETPEAEPAVEEPEKTKQVDKAAILAGMAVAAEMVERDRAFAAAQTGETVPAVEVPVAEEPKIELPDFLGHEEPAAEEAPAVKKCVNCGAEINSNFCPYCGTKAEEPAPVVEEPVAEETPVEEPVVEEPVVEETQVEEAPAEEIAEPVSEEPAAEETPAEEPVTEEPAEDVEFDIFQVLEGMEEPEPAEQIVLGEEQKLEDLFADTETTPQEEAVHTGHTLILDENSVAEILNAAGELPDAEAKSGNDTMVFTAHTLGAILAEAEQSDPDAEEIVVSMEDLIKAENAVTEAAAADAEEDDEAVELAVKTGKGRTVLKVFLVILILLLLVEVAAIGIELIAPTSAAADFIDTQIKNLFNLLSDSNAVNTDVIG